MVAKPCIANKRGCIATVLPLYCQCIASVLPLYCQRNVVVFSMENGLLKNSVLGGTRLRWPLYSGHRNSCSSPIAIFSSHIPNGPASSLDSTVDCSTVALDCVALRCCALSQPRA